MGLGIGEEFHKRHGADCINCHGQLIYSDGASRDRDLMGALFEPPRDPHELYTLQFRYREELLRRVIQDFTDIKQRLQSSARANK
ncbi:MAG: hypothetical protein JSS02_30255, partial [Planctomycetes bacterium]|nr:hypothetical protein [Planctomycetota bacterium]